MPADPSRTISEQQGLFIVAGGYLVEKIEIGEVSFRNFKESVQVHDINPTDGTVYFEPDSAILSFLDSIAKAAVRRFVLTTGEATMEELKDTLRAFGYGVTTGLVTPTTVANLCKCTVGDFQAILQSGLAKIERNRRRGRQDAR